MNGTEICYSNASRQNYKKNVIYDIGANNGDDTSYYLRKSNIVVAVEANPDLCRQIQERFLLEIQQERLIIENCVLTAEQNNEKVPFYIHKTKHTLSRFSPPKATPDQFERVLLPSKSVSQLFEDHGSPYYVKIDIEGYDHVILRSLLKNGVKPYYLSAESHNIEVFLLLTSFGGYNSFKVIQGRSVVDEYCNHPIKTMDGEEVYSFPRHSAGPFGEDVCGNWIDSERLFCRLKLEGLGWKDIHARKEDAKSQQSKSRIPWQIKYWFYKIQWFIWKGYRKIKHKFLR